MGGERRTRGRGGASFSPSPSVRARGEARRRALAGGFVRPLRLRLAGQCSGLPEAFGLLHK